MRRSRAFSALLALAIAGCKSGAVRTASIPATDSISTTESLAAGCPVAGFRAPVAPAYADTIWPSEKHDEWRTAAVSGGLPATIRALHAKSVKLPPVPVWGYVGLDGNVYVLGGQPYLLDIYTKLMLGSTESEKRLLEESLAYSEVVKPYVARVDPVTMAVTVLYLPQKHGINYIGGMLVHSNGYLYAVARAVLYKIDPKSFTIVASTRLPLAPGTSGKPDPLTAYNGMQATVDGDLILKGFASLVTGPGILIKVRPSDLAIVAKSESTAIGGARIALATSGTQQYVYNAGSTDSIRFLVDRDSFTLDSAFSRQYLYAGSGSTEGTSEVYMGDGVVFASNTTPAATTPITIFAQAAADGSSLSSQAAFSGTEKGWNWEMPSGDPYRTGIVAVQDQLSGRVSGFFACNGGASTRKLWENRTIRDSTGMAINIRDGQLYADDHRCVKRLCTLALVVLDLRTGREIARTKVAGTEPAIAQIFVGPHDAIFHIASDTDRPNGYLTRITAR